MKLSDILLEGEYVSIFDPAKIDFHTITHYTDSLSNGALFVCLKSEQIEVSRLLRRAVADGVSAIITDTLPPEPIDTPLFLVDNARATLATLFARLHGNPQDQLTCIGVTGTNGKSSTSTMLYHLLQKAGCAVALIGTVGCFFNGKVMPLPEALTMTTPEPKDLFTLMRRLVDLGAEYLIMEVSSHAIVQCRTLPIRFALGLFTNLSAEHLDYHKTIEEYARVKASFFATCKTSIIHIDSPYAELMIENSQGDILTCSSRGTLIKTKKQRKKEKKSKPKDEKQNKEKKLKKRHLHFSAEDLCYHTLFGVSYHCTCTKNGKKQKESFPVSVPILGRFTIDNALLATVAGRHLNLSTRAIQHGFASMPCIDGRMEMLDLKDFSVPFSVMIDFAHTPFALHALLSSLQQFKIGRLVILFGCGGDRDREKRPEMGRIAEELADFVYVTSDNARSEEPRYIIKDILSGMQKTEKRKVIIQRKEAIKTALKELLPDDLLVLAGKGHETYEIDKAGLHDFDERLVVRSCLLAMQNKGEPNDENPSISGI